MKTVISLIAGLLLFSGCARGQDMGGHHHTPAASPTDAIETQDWAKQRLAKSPRHQEWVKVKNGTREVNSFVVYPEVKNKATAVVVIHEIFGMSDWVQSLTDQLAEAGYIAIAPDLLSGMGPNGGGTSSLDRNGVGQAIRDLPPDLMSAFRATLDELRDADLLLHVVDVSSPAMEDHIRAVETILSDLEMDDIPRLMVLNKMDLVESEVVANLARSHQAVPIAARDRRTLPRLIERLQDVIWDQLHNDPRLVASGVS